MSKRQQKYLKTKARVDALENCPALGNFDAVVVIPVLDESSNIKTTLDSLEKIKGDFATILVINNREDECQERIKDNQELLQKLRDGVFSDLKYLYWIDRSSPTKELPAETGVGLARRIGMDTALTILKGNGLLLSLDADTLVEVDYIESAKQILTQEIDAGCFNFRHQSAESEMLQNAIDSYEEYLHHYVEGLKVAHSPYAYHAIGSIIAVTAEAYVLADGMPLKRQAAEDFYFLQNIAKHCRVKEIPSTVYPSARLSTRTPFGTGQQMLQVQEDNQHKNFFADSSFLVLKEFLALVNQNLNSSQIDFIDELENSYTTEYLKQLNFEKVWSKLQLNYKTSSQKKQAFERWFDALKTLKFIKGFKDEKK